MILANVAAAETLEAQHSPLIYRAHDAPSVEKLNDLVEFPRHDRRQARQGRAHAARPFQRRARPRARARRSRRSSTKWCCAPRRRPNTAHENYGHFGLNLRRYAHFTSPIRRYADLIVHRALIRALNLGDGRPRRRAGAANWRRSPSTFPPPSGARWRPSARRSTVWSPRISPIASARSSRRASPASPSVGLFVKLAETGADGFVPAATIGDDYFRFEEATRALVGTRSGGDVSSRAMRSRCGWSRPRRSPARCVSRLSASGAEARRRRAGLRSAIRAGQPDGRSGDERHVALLAAFRAPARPVLARGDPARLPRSLSGLRPRAAVPLLSQGRQRPARCAARI